MPKVFLKVVCQFQPEGCLALCIQNSLKTNSNAFSSEILFFFNSLTSASTMNAEPA